MWKEKEIDEFLDTNPDRNQVKLFCQHYALSFFHYKNSEKASKASKAYWAKVTPEEKAERIRKMTQGRVDKSR